MRKPILFVLTLIILISLLFIIQKYLECKDKNFLRDTGGRIGKQVIIVVEKDELVDYRNANNKLVLLSEKDKIANYMHEKNLIIKPGKYKLNQASTFEVCLRILKFKKG